MKPKIDKNKQNIELPDYVTSAIKDGKIPVIRDWRSLPVTEMTRAERNMAFIERYLRVPEGRLVGKPIKLELFQEAFIYSVFDNKTHTRTAIFSIARKNGKSALCAAILCCFIIGPEARQNAQIASGAMSAKQASILRRLATQMMSLNPALSSKFRTKGNEIIGLSKNVVYSSLASESSTAQGLSCYVVLHDETAQIKHAQSDFVDSLNQSQGAYDEPFTFYLSTQAETDGQLFSLLIDDAIQNKEPSVVCHLYESPKDCDLLDEKAWKYSNPALDIFRSRNELATNCATAIRLPSQENSTRLYYLNQRVIVKDTFIDPADWAACKAEFDIFEIAKKPEVKLYGGLDLSLRRDLTAFMLIAHDTKEDIVYIHPTFWLPKEEINEKSEKDKVPYLTWADNNYLNLTPTRTIDYDFVVNDVNNIINKLSSSIDSIAFDAWKIDSFKTSLSDKGVSLPLISQPQNIKSMSPLIDKLESYIINNKLKHTNHPIMNWCVYNTVVYKNSADYRRLEKFSDVNRIDGVVALTMALGLIGEINTISKQEVDDWLTSLG